MSILEPPTTDPNAGGRPADDLDGLLRAYFRAEMPRPWPEFRAPAQQASRNGFVPNEGPPARLSEPSLPFRRPWAKVRSRLALAASVAVLMGASLFLAGQFRGNVAEQPVGPASGNTSGPASPKDRYEMKERLEQEGQDAPTKFVIEFFEKY